MENKQIEAMARVMCGREKSCLVCPVQTPCLMRNCAHLLYAENYRQIPEGAIVLTRAELDALTEYAEKIKGEVAREIFEEIEEDVLDFTMSDSDIQIILDKGRYDELKKKYTEGTDTNVLTNTEWKIEEGWQVADEPLDLSDAKFIDDEGNIHEPTPRPEPPPSCTTTAKCSNCNHKNKNRAACKDCCVAYFTDTDTYSTPSHWEPISEPTEESPEEGK